MTFTYVAYPIWDCSLLLIIPSLTFLEESQDQSFDQITLFNDFVSILSLYGNISQVFGILILYF